MLILAADTSTPYLSVALCENDTVLAESTLYANRLHAEKILLYVDAMLSETRTQLPAIDLFAVTIGPGSFTGLRVGVSAWKGLAAGVKTPIIGIPTLCALAARVPMFHGHICPMLDAKMDEVYASLYQYHEGIRQKMEGPVVASVEAVLERCPSDTVFFGDGATRYKDVIHARTKNPTILPSTFDAPRASSVAEEALVACADGLPPLDNLVSPIYLRKSQAEENRDATETPAS